MALVSSIAIVSVSSLDRGVVQRMAEAVHRQLRDHVAPAWGRAAPEVAFYDRLEDVPSWVPPIVLFDHVWEADALGYHSETPDGRAFGRVFLDVVFEDGGVVLYDGPRLNVSSIVSHEAIELMIDPDCNVWADGPPSPYGQSYALEACDPVNGDTYPVLTGDGTLVGVANFLYPDWFDPEAPPGRRFDHMGRLPQPFSMGPQGHILIRSAPGTEELIPSPALPYQARFTSLQFPAARTYRRIAGRAGRPRRPRT